MAALPLTFIFSGGALFVSRKYLGRGPFYLLLIFVFSMMIPNLAPQFWLGFLSMALMIGVFVEAKLQHSSDLKAGLISILSTCGLLSIGTGIWIQTKKIDVIATLKAEVNRYVETLSIAAELDVDVDLLLAQLPSGIVGAMIIGLWVSMMMERFIIRKKWAPKSFLSYGGMKPESHYGFRLPEWTIWPVLASILFAFVELKVPALQEFGMNFFNVFIVIYLLQGLAVISSFFKDHQVGVFWQVAWYLLFIQMYAVVSLIGFADYWFDFRKKFMSAGHEANIKK
jgi:hypothetical protein